MKGGKLTLIRHGESTWNAEERFAGSSDVPLTEKGREQAKSAGISLASLQFDLVFTSRLDRARETFLIMKPYLSDKTPRHIEHKALNERDFGILEGLKKSDLAASYSDAQMERWRFDFDEPMPEGRGEMFRELSDRVWALFEKEILQEIARGKHVLIVAHGQVLRSLCMRLEGALPHEGKKYYIENATPITFIRSVDGENFRRI
ncbi:MAG: 2,3-bisphosphoglycerate-dependent phosphoglycerate mutase [Flavobacteriales bacterium]|nr:2,3-bisphosphoglycerate-dependent phosphoglycerate mutase [Flavobacteriales bacterium]